MMKKLLLKVLMLACVLGMSTNVAWADDCHETTDDPTDWFYVQMNAKISSTPCTTTSPGQLKVSFIKQNGDLYDLTDSYDKWELWIPNNPKPVNPYAGIKIGGEGYVDGMERWGESQGGFCNGVSDVQAGYTEKHYPNFYYNNNNESEGMMDTWLYAKEGYDAGFDWYIDGSSLINANPTEWGTTASIKGYSTLYSPGIDMGPLGGLMSTYVHFNAIVKENPGWYFVGWSYMNGGTDIAGTVTTDPEDEQNNIFEILPSSKKGIGNIRTQDVYATFQPVLVADYKVAGMIPGINETTTVTFDYVGERVDATDFDITIADEEGTPSKFEQFGDADYSVVGKVTITVKYTGSVVGEHRGSVTLASKSGCSSLTAPVFARVPSDATIEASLYDGQTPTATTGSLTDMINAAHKTDYIVTLNKNYGIALTVDKVVKMDLNGYQVTSALTIANGGVLTLNYSKYGGKLINNITVQNGGKLILNGAEITGTVTVNAGGELVQNGATITGAVTNNGTLTATEGKLTNGLTSAGTLTINGGAFEGTTAIAVTGGTATINKGSISGSTYGIQTSNNPTVEVTSKLVSVYGGTNAVNGKVTLTNGKFDGATPLSGSVTLNGGYFKVDGEHLGIAVPEGKKVLNVLAGVEYAEGYRYFVGDDASTVGVCRIGTTSYETLEKALAYANNNSNKEVVIIMTNDYTLPAGYYTLPAKAKLIVPMSNDQETDNPIIPRVSNSSAHRVAYAQPTEFRRLTFATGVNMEVFGLIELTCTQRASDDAYAAMPHGNYGHLVMEEGSRMVLQSGAELRAWGYMTGKGETDARRGSTVREQFQMGDWKGGSNSFNMINPDMDGGNPNLSYFHIFPITQYFIQNVESPVKYHPGAELSTTTSVAATLNESGTVGITAAANDIPVVGVSGDNTAMFLMDIAADAENTWVRKWYDAEHDVQTYEVNSGAHIGSMVLNLGSLGSWNIVMNSGQFVLPIMNNMKIHLLSGEMDFTQSTSLLPGAEVEIDKESTVSITKSSDPAIVSGSLYVYDAAQWIHPVWGKFGDQSALPGAGGLSYKNTVVVKYSPSWDRSLVGGDKPIDGKPTIRDEHGTLESASINVHGTFDAKQGFVFTTENGANIHSTNEDAGTFIYTNPAPANEYVFYINPIEGTSQAYGGLIYGQVATSAQLKNGDNSYTQTTDAGEHQSFIYMDNEWKTSENEFIQLLYFDCFTAEANMQTYGSHIIDEDYVKQIAMAEAPVRIREYLIADAFAKAHDFEEGIAPHEYEYFRTNYYAAVAAMGKDKGEESMVSQMQNSGIPQQVAAAPLVPLIPGFKEQAESYSGTYDLGDAVQKIYIKPQEWLEIVGQAHIQLGLDAETIEGFETTYTTTSGLALDQVVEDYLDYITDNLQNPYLVGVDGNTDHTYSDAAGAGRLFILMTNEFGDCDQWWEVEKKNNLYHCIHPNNDTYYYYDEDDEIWKEQMFSVSWKNWNGDIIQTAGLNGALVDEYYVKYGTMAEFLGTNPTREANIDYTYDFTGWAPALGPVTSDVTYTATYTEKPRMYTIIFQQEGGVEIERHFLTHNEVPVCENVPTKVGHTLQWNPAISAVTGDATYTASWLENPPTEYQVTFYDYDGTTILQQDNVAVGAMPEYTEATPNSKEATSEFTYVFDHWSPALEEVSATSIKSYTAIYAEVAKTYTVKFVKENGDPNTPADVIESHQYQYGETPVCSELPTKAATAQYTYALRWTPQIQTVMADANYTAVFDATTNKYTVTLKANPSGACTFSGAGTFDYGTAISISRSDNDGYTFTNWTDKDGNTVSDLPATITADINLVANFTVANPDYTITWKSFDGNTILAEVGQKANTATIYTGEIPTKPASTQYVFTFDGWTTEANGAGTFYKNNMTPKATASVSYYAHFAAQEVVMEVGLGQAQNISEATTVNQLILNSNGIVSGQLTGNIADLDVMGACYYDLTGTFTAGKWYAVAVPWQVTAGMITANGSPLSWNSGNYLAYYDGSIRAAQGKVDACWKYVSNSDVLVPGRLYMLYLENSASLLRFPKKAGAPILNTSTGVAAFNSAAPADANWNGIANPAIFYAYLSNTGATVGQVFNADAQSYEAVALSNKLIVAKPIFVQATNNGSATAVTTPPTPAPARRNEAAQTLNAEYQVEIASYGRMQDRLFINTNEDKEADTYTIGQDVLKFGVSDKVAQMWVNRYDAKLCMNTMAPVNSVAEFPLSIFAPKAGEYTIAIEKEKASEDHTLYLTYNGEAIWNLSEDAYTAELQKGTDANYGLRISVKNAPQTTTGMDEAVVDAQGETKKVLIDNQVFIIRGDKVYSIDGQLVK